MKIENFGKIIEKISNSFKSHLMRSLLWTLVIVIVALVIRIVPIPKIVAQISRPLATKPFAKKVLLPVVERS